MSTLERLRTTLAALNLTAIDARLEPLLESASKNESAYADFLLEVMSTEADARRQRYLKTRLQLGSHRLDEFAASYSLAGCTPALPASASLADFSVPLNGQISKPPRYEGWGIFDRQNEEFSTGVDT